MTIDVARNTITRVISQTPDRSPSTNSKKFEATDTNLAF